MKNIDELYEKYYNAYKNDYNNDDESSEIKKKKIWLQTVYIRGQKRWRAKTDYIAKMVKL